MSQFSNGVVLQEMSLKTNPVIDTYGSVRAESDLFSTLVLNAGPGTIGYNTGLGFPTFTGLAAKSLAQGMFERDIASPAAVYYKDVPSNLTGDPKPMLAWYESTFPEIRKMKDETGFSFDGHDTAEDAYEAMALAYGNWKAQQYYSDPFSSGSSVAVGIASLGIEILGDPTTWVGAGLGKLAVQKATTKVAEKALVTQLGRVAAEGAVTNAVQTFAQSVAGQQQRYDLWGVVPDSNIDTTAMIAGGLFGAMLPVAIAGGIHGIGSGLDASARYVDKNLGNPDSFVNKVARMAGAPVLRNEPIDHLTGLGVAAENAEMVAGTHKYLYSDVTGNSVLEIALTKDYWDEVANTGIDAKQYAAWGLRTKPSQDEAGAFLEGLMDEAQRIRDAEANGGQSPAVAKANKDLQEVTLKVDNAFVDVEDPEIANRGTAWALVNIKRQLIAGGATADDAAEQSLSLMAMIAAKAASKDMGTDEWIARNIKNFTIDRNPKTGETLFSIQPSSSSFFKINQKKFDALSSLIGATVERLSENGLYQRDIRLASAWRRVNTFFLQGVGLSSDSLTNPTASDYSIASFLDDLQTIVEINNKFADDPEIGPAVGLNRVDPREIQDIFDSTYTQKNPTTGVVQAAVSFSPVDGRAIIRAFTGATNFSSMVHELGHIFRRDLDPDQLAAANRWVGATAGTKWTTKQEEQFARGFEKWLRGRKNTGSPMDGVFQKMKNWMLSIYQTIKGSPLDHVRLNDEIVNVFESMFRKGNGTVELTSPASGPPVAKFGLGRVKLRIAGDVERALFALHKTKTQKDRYALVAFLRKHTGMSDNEILTASRFVWSEVRSKVREAKSKLRATNRPADVRVDTNGSPYVVVELGDLKKIYDPEELGAMRFKEKFSNIGAPTTIETLQAELAAIRDEQAKLEYSDDAEKIAAVRKMKNKTARKLAHAVEKFFPNASGRTGSAAVVGDIDSGIVEKTAGTKLDSTETARVMLDGERKGNLKGDWLVFNSTRAIKTLRKVGNFFSTGHLETVGSDNPIVAKLARLVSEGIIYRDAFGPTKFKAIGLEQHRHRVKAMAGEAIREIEAVLKDVDPAIHQEVTKMAVARASGATYAGLSDPAATGAAEAMAAIYTKIYNRFGVEGIQNGYFRNTIDNYGGTFHILGTKRKASELADALYSVWREHFTKEDSPIHRRTFKSIPSISLEAYPKGGPKVLADLLPDDRAKYLKALLDESVRNGIYTSGLKREAQLVANNKLGFTELKELIVDDSLGLVHSDPSLSRQINVDVWFDPRVSGFVDWDPYGNIQKYLEITGYRVKEQTDINKVVKELLGYDRRDVDAIGLVRGIRDLLLSDDKLVDADREIIKQSFQYLENQVNVLRSHVNRDYSRQMGAMDTVANVTMNLGRTGVSARSAMAGLSTEIIPMLLATTFRHPKNILPILKSTLSGLSKWQLKGLMAGYNHMFTHRPDVLNHVADIPSINHSWLDKTFINPYKQLKASGQTGDATKTRIGNILTSATSMLHRMSSGLGGEDFFQKMATNVAAMQTTYRIADKFEKMKKLAAAMDGHSWSDDVTVREKQFRKLAYDNGFGEDTAWAAKLNQAGLLEKDFVSAMDAINTASGGRLLNDPNGAFDQNLIERIIGTNAENSRFYEAMNDRLLRFVEADIKTRVTTPGVQDSNIPAGGLDPITRMAQMFMSFQRSWFHHVLLNGVSNSKLQYGLSFLGTMLVGELIYYHAYRMLYRGDSWEDLEKEWTENPSVMIVEAVGRTNLFGSASAIGQHVLDIVSDSGAARGGSIYSLKVAGNLFQSSVNLTKAALSKEDIDPADARRIELMTGGLNAWWVRPLMQATGYDSFSEWIFKDQPAG